MNFTVESLKFLIVDDHPLFRKSIVRLLMSMNPSIHCHEAGNGFEALYKFKNNNFDIVFLDIQMPKMDGIECFKKLRLLNPECKVIVISSYDSNNYIKEFMEKGVNGYLLKNIDDKILIDAIEAVNKNEQFISPEIYSKWYQFKQDLSKRKFIVPLSLREKEIVILMCQNLNSKEISKLLGISIATVKNHRSHIINKLGAKNIADVIVFAIKEGIYQIETH